MTGRSAWVWVAVAAAIIVAILFYQRSAHGLEGCLSLSEARGGSKAYASWRLVNGRKCWFINEDQHRVIKALREPNRYRPRRDNHPPKPPEPPDKPDETRAGNQMRLDETFNEIGADADAEPTRAGANAASAAVRVTTVKAVVTPWPAPKRLEEDGRDIGIYAMMLGGSTAAFVVVMILLSRRRQA